MDNFPVHKILKRIYKRVQSLESFALEKLGPAVSKDELVSEGDKQSFHEFLKNTIVATGRDFKETNLIFSKQQEAHQSEIILRAMDKIMSRRKPNNVLTFGCSPMSSDPLAKISFSRNFECRVVPNSSVTHLQNTAWKKLVSRMGDELMQHLLESRAVFVPLQGSNCYRQICGFPVYEYLSSDKKLGQFIRKKSRIQKKRMLKSAAVMRYIRRKTTSKKKKMKKHNSRRP